MSLRGLTPSLKLMRWKPSDSTGDRWGERLRLQGEQLRAAWARFLGNVPWVTMATLTFDPRKRFNVSRETASRETFRWCGLASLALRQPLAWVYATERQASGRWHTHVLLADAEPDQCKAPVAIWEARNGLADVRPVSYSHGALRYIAKEAAEEGELVLSDTITRYKAFLVSDPQE